MLDTLNLLLNNYEVWEIKYKGQGVSSNDFYASSGRNAWKTRKKLVDTYKIIFGDLIKKAKLPWFEEYGLLVQYNSKHDPSNVGGLIKCFEDTFKQKTLKGKIVHKGYCEDDDKEHCKLCAILPDTRLPNNTFIFKLVKIR